MEVLSAQPLDEIRSRSMLQYISEKNLYYFFLVQQNASSALFKLQCNILTGLDLYCLSRLILGRDQRDISCLQDSVKLTNKRVCGVRNCR